MAATRLGSDPPRAALATLEILARLLRAAIAASFVVRFFGASRFFLALRDGMGGKNNTGCPRNSERSLRSLGGMKPGPYSTAVILPRWGAAVPACRRRAAPLQGGQEHLEFAEGLAAMAVLIFFGGGDLGEGLFQRREIEDRIVAEACGAARRFEDLTIDASGDDGASAAALGQSDGADKMRVSFGGDFAAKRCEQLGISFEAGGVGSSVASGLHAGCSAERGNDQTGVVSENEGVEEVRVVQSLPCGIFGEAGSVFLECWQGCELRQQLQFNRAARSESLRQRAILGEFSRAGRCEIQLNGRAH